MSSHENTTGDILNGPSLHDRLASALAKHPEVELTWRHRKNGPKLAISPAELIETLLMVNQSDKFFVRNGTYSRGKKKKTRWKQIHVGLSISRLATRLRFHRAKASRALVILRDIQMIAKIANYSVGNCGNRYRLLNDGETPPPPPTPLSPPSPSGNPTVNRPLDDDDPFA